MTSRARLLQEQGIDVISFAAGEPDFNTPEPICEAAIEAIRAGKTKYTASSGTPELKRAIVDKALRENGLACEPDQVVASCGAKHSCYNAFQVLVDPGDEVILLAPYWMTYADQIRLAGGKVVTVSSTAETAFVPSFEAIRDAITSKTRAIVINSPSNPTGAVYPRSLVESIAELARRHGIWIVSDEIYERLVYEGVATCVAAIDQDTAERTITISGCSKTYAMTGWRLGYAIAPKPVAKAMGNLQDQVTSNPASIVQAAAVAAYQLSTAAVDQMRSEFQHRRDSIVRALADVPGVRLECPHGAFYAFVDVSNHLNGSIRSDTELADFLLDRAHVATVPGSVFGGPGYLRMSYATSPDRIESGIARIRAALETIA
ncbi:MAG: Aspartate aminotransferase [Fimbriimonadaceae bacterium]|nr:Aspartate aminotransferase [Fimbriimonadaceae bacterium]